MAKKSTLSTPAQAAPHPVLMSLVGQFLEKNGFHAAHQSYTIERTKAASKKERKNTSSQSVINGLPPLESIFKTWQQEHSEEATSVSSSDNDTSDSSSGESADPMEIVASSESESESSSDSESSSGASSDDSDEEVDDIEETTSAVVSAQKAPKSVKRKLSYSSSESSDTSEDEEGATQSRVESRPSKKARIESASSSSDSDQESASTSDSGTDSDSDSESDASSTSETHQMAVNTELPSSSASSSTDSSSEDETDTKTAAAVISSIDKALSDSSGTIVGDIGIVPTTSESSANEQAVETTQVTVTKRKHIGAHPTRLAQISAAANLDDHVSNTYVSYEYADKAYKDLSVTRGKGFTKEKNKKKRGSYRGGAIDISGGKAFKFDD